MNVLVDSEKKTIELLNMRVDTRWIDYSDCGDICVTYEIEYKGKLSTRYAKIDFTGQIYSHNGMVKPNVD